jgi:hypothetical protein
MGACLVAVLVPMMPKRSNVTQTKTIFIIIIIFRNTFKKDAALPFFFLIAALRSFLKTTLCSVYHQKQLRFVFQFF